MRGRCKDLVLSCRGVGDSAIWRSNCLGCLLHDLTCIRRSARQPIVPPNRRRATSRRGQMETYYMNLSPGTNPGGLIRLRMLIGMMWSVSHSCKAMHNVCGTQRSRKDRHPSPWACGVALLMVHMSLHALSHAANNSKCFILGMELEIEVVYLGGGSQPRSCLPWVFQIEVFYPGGGSETTVREQFHKVVS